MYGLPNFRTNGGPRLFDYFEGSGKYAVGANDLKAQAFGDIGEDAIDFLGLASGKAG